MVDGERTVSAQGFDDGSPAALFINDIGKEGSTLRGVLAMVAIATSLAWHCAAPPRSWPASSYS